MLCHATDSVFPAGGSNAVGSIPGTGIAGRDMQLTEMHADTPHRWSSTDHSAPNIHPNLRGLGIGCLACGIRGRTEESPAARWPAAATRAGTCWPPSAADGRGATPTAPPRVLRMPTAQRQPRSRPATMASAGSHKYERRYVCSGFGQVSGCNWLLVLALRCFSCNVMLNVFWYSCA